jgi:hypothetical protein
MAATNSAVTSKHAHDGYDPVKVLGNESYISISLSATQLHKRSIQKETFREIHKAT